MRGWPLVALSDLLTPADDAVAVQEDGRYPNVGMYCFGRGLFRKAPIEGMATSAHSLFRLRAGNFVYSRLFAFEGAYGVVDDSFDGHFVSNEYPSFAIDTTRLLPGYLSAYFRRPTAWRAIAMGSKGVGSRRIRVHPERVLAHAIPLPPLPEQEAIVARLDALADKTRQLAAHLDAVETEAEALVLALHHRLTGECKVRLADVIELHEDSVPVRPDQSYKQVGVRSFAGGLFAKPAVAGTETTYRTFNRLYPDALVLSQVKGWEGAIALTPPSLVGMFVSPEYRTFRCLPERASPQYLGEIVKTPWFWSLLQDATRGVGARRERTRPEQFLNVVLPMPDFDKQAKAAGVFTRLATLKSRHAAIREANAALLPATLERLFSASVGKAR